MKLPQGYLGKGFRFGQNFDGQDVTRDSGKVCKLIKSLYGLKQAPRQVCKAQFCLDRKEVQSVKN